MRHHRTLLVAFVVIGCLLAAHEVAAQICGAVTAPQCDGQCPLGQMCADSGGSCACVPAAAACENPANPNGPPVCWGACPNSSMVCATFAGGCLCLPGPTPTPTPTPTATPNLCGNGTVDLGEPCDDSNGVNGDGCDNNCTITACGNGIATAGEECDGADAPLCPAACLGDCTCAVCGDNVTEGPEQCDGIDDSACPFDCQQSCTCLVPAPVIGNKLLYKDASPIDPTKRKLVFLSKGPQIDVTAGAGFDPLVNGATLQLFNAGGSGESACMTLPQAGWFAKGIPPKIIFKYKDKIGPGPCRVALVKNLKLVKVVCRGAAITYTLDELSQGSLGVRLSSGGTSFCGVFGGVVKDEPGIFTAKNAAPPPACPAPPIGCP